MAKTIIGLTGTFASGCTTIATAYIRPNGYEYISLSDILRQLAVSAGVKTDLRSDLQDFGNSIREAQGSGYLATIAIKTILESKCDKFIIDSIRNPNEVKLLRDQFPNFFLMGIYADRDIRWNRCKSIYSQHLGHFEDDEERDRSESLDHGQRVADCFLESDLVIANDHEIHLGNDFDLLMKSKINKYLSLIENPFTQNPSEEEAIMAMAYTNGQRSSCLKRRVGAVIVDEYGNIFSSGYNEVPVEDKSCRQMYGGCYRDKLKRELKETLDTIPEQADVLEKVLSGFKSLNKLLDHCRALHAEENAIINVARFGTSFALKGATLYTTTYPCNLCANKIAQVGIRKIVYFEPYPMKEAKEILSKQGTEQKPFEGITFRGYSRVF